MEEFQQSLAQAVADGGGDSEMLGNGGFHQGRIADGGEGNIGDATGKIRFQEVGNVQGEAGLADTARSDDRDEGNTGIGEKLPQGGDFCIATDEGIAREGQGGNLGGAWFDIRMERQGDPLGLWR